jgi:hypothetical protein
MTVHLILYLLFSMRATRSANFVILIVFGEDYRHDERKERFRNLKLISGAEVPPYRFTRRKPMSTGSV